MLIKFKQQCLCGWNTLRVLRLMSKKKCAAFSSTDADSGAGNFSSKTGMTLIEVMFVSVLICIAVAGTATVLVNATRLRMDSRARRRATIEANSAMEQAFWLAGYDSGSLPVGSSVYMTYDAQGEADISTSGDPGLTWGESALSKSVTLSRKLVETNPTQYVGVISVDIEFDTDGRALHFSTERRL